MSQIRGRDGDIDLHKFVPSHVGFSLVLRVVAEVASLALGTFVAAGFAHGREKVAAVIGGLTISLYYVARLSIAYYLTQHFDPDNYQYNDPSVQYFVDGFVLLAAPLIGVGVSQFAVEIHDDTPTGFGGINRWHFAWLWLAAGLYAMALIAPLVQFWATAQRNENWIADGLRTIVEGVPIFALSLPAYFGLLLSGNSGSAMSPLMRNVAGMATIVIGFVLGIVFQYYWAKLMLTLTS